jgi:Pyridoxamine 5'-phosphate oxidase
MGKIYEVITPDLEEWIARQRVFFVATSPLAADGHVNCSPKGLDSLRVLGPTRVAYQDLTGSGIETVAHVKENGRIVIMFCAFEGSPRILRLHGQARVIEPGCDEYQEMLSEFPALPGTRSFVRVELTRIADSCGFGVPLYNFAGTRDTLPKFCEKKGLAALEAYREEHNRRSIDGLSGLT